MDDIRMTRMTRAEGAMRIMGMRLAYRLGINFFDWKNESVPTQINCIYYVGKMRLIMFWTSLALFVT